LEDLIMEYAREWIKNHPEEEESVVPEHKGI
jgi:hypothetical protein